MEAQRSDFSSKKWCGERENAREIKLVNSDNGGREERNNKKKKKKMKKKGGRPKFQPPLPLSFK